MKIHHQLGFLALIATTFGCTTHTYAQSVDYTSLQDVFNEPVTTSATGTPQRASEVPADMTIITANEIRQSGTRKIPEILGMYVPGLDILQTSENSFDVGVRGFQQVYQPRLLVLIDGRQVFLDDYSRTNWSNLPVNVDDIRQIEVTKGASSALFGSNAAAGVVNIITYSPFYDANNVATVAGGTQESLSGDATGTMKIADLGGIKISAGGMNANEFHTGNNSADLPNPPNPSHRYVSENSIFQITPDVQAFTEMTYSHGVDNPAYPSALRENQNETNYSLRGGLSAQTPYGLIASNNYLNHSFIRFETESSGVIALYNFTSDLVVSQLTDQFKVDADHTFHLALEYRHKTYNDVSVSQVLPQAPILDEDTFAASGTWLWQINDKLSWTNALRIDHEASQESGTLFAGSSYTSADYSHDINALSANSGFVYKATDLDTFRATYGRGVQMPSLIQNQFNQTLNGSGFIYDIEGNPRLKPTITQNYELDYDRQVPALFSTARFAVYYENVHDIVGFLNSTSSLFTKGGNSFILAQSTNVGNSDGFGGEIELKGKSPGGIRWDGSYSFARAVDDQTVANTVGYDGSAPEHHFRLSGGYTTGPWELDAHGQYVTSTHMYRATSSTSSAQTPTDGYATLGGRIGYNINDRFAIAASAINITRATTQESPYPAIERQAFLSLTGKF